MSTLFFEGFNISNNNRDIYLDPKYWTKSLGTVPYTQSLSGLFSTVISSNTPNTPADIYTNTFGYINISGAKNFTNPPEYQTYIQLSGVSGIDTSSGIYIAFRVLGLNYNDPITTPPPHAQKVISFNNGDVEYLTIEAIKVTGESSYAPNWSSSFSNGTGIALRVVQNSNNKALYDMRIPGISDYDIRNPASSFFVTGNPNLYSFGISTNSTYTRFVHLELYIKNTGLELRIEGLETKDTYSGNTGLVTIDSGIIDNIKFYNRNISQNMLEYFLPGNQPTANMFWGESAGTISYDDICIIKEDDAAPNYWLGETCRIIPLIFSDNNPFGAFFSQILRDWTSEGFSPPLVSRDGDNNYIYASDSGNIYSIRPTRTDTNPSYMQKDIGGIRIFNEARKVFLNSSFINVYATGAGTENSDFYEIGDQYSLSNTNYNIYNSFVMTNPVTNDVWTSGDIFGTRFDSTFTPSGIFGVKKL